MKMISYEKEKSRTGVVAQSVRHAQDVPHVGVDGRSGGGDEGLRAESVRETWRPSNFS